MLTFAEGERCASIRILIAIFVLSVVGSAHAGCIPPDCAPAEGWDNFANNLGSDFAPLLALFGEQVTTQYLSESLNWTDCLLFALAPLGIITAMVAAIRVAGSSILRSVIGRAKETRGDVEADLMSSTSSDVCELWSGKDVVRVLGTPVLLQLVYVKSEVKNKDSAGIFNFRDRATRDRLYKPPKQGYAQPPPVTNTTPAGVDEQGSDAYLWLYSDIDNFEARNNPPNLSLNVNIKPIPLRRMVVFLIIGILVQGAVLMFAAISQYKLRLPKNNTSIPGYAFPVFLFGTVTLAGGVFLCALAVERSTKETTWEPWDPKTTRAVWLQQGGQKVGDQQFESFARLDSPGVIYTSMKEGNGGGAALVTVAVCVTLLGFIAQFFGLRATHSSVIVLQLGAILLMTALRSYAHVDRESHNHITEPNQVEGHELDWLAKDLGGCSTWEVMTVSETARTPPPPRAGVGEKPGPALATESEIELMPAAVMRTRARLARLSKDWVLESREKVGVLQNAIEGTMNNVFTSMKLEGNRNDESSFEWGVPVKAKAKQNDYADLGEVGLTLTRKRDETGSWGDWKVDNSELEAILCLWVSSLAEFDRTQAKESKPRLKQIRLLGPATLAANIDYKLWIHRGTEHRQTKLKKEERYFGWGGSLSDEYLCVDADKDLETLCAQGLYTLFLGRLVSWVEGVGGTTTRRTNDSNTGLSPPVESEKPWEHLHLSNSNLASLAQIFAQSSLGTIEEAYLCIIPVFSTVEKPPYPDEVYSWARKASKALSKEGKWKDVAEIDSWLYQNSSPTNAPTYVIKVEVARRLHTPCEQLLSGIKEHEGDENLRPMWDFIDSRCRELSTAEPSNDLSFPMVTRCMTYRRFNTQADPKEFLELVSDTIKYLTRGEVSGRLSCEDDVSKEPESFAKFLFNEIYNDSFQEKEDDDPLDEIIALVRTLSGDIFSGKEITGYFDNPKSLKVAADTTANAQLEIPSVDIPIDMLLSRKYLSPLQLAARIGKKRIVKKLLDAGAQINAEPARFGGRTALQAAAEGGHSEVVQFLLERGANPKAKPALIEGQTALQAAAGAGHLAVVEQLLAAGTNDDPGRDYGRTALQAAAEGGHEDIVQFLLDKGADFKAQPAAFNGRTALQAAAGAGHSSIVLQLLDLGAAINERPKSSYGRTALQAAAENGHEEIVELLLTRGANVDTEPALFDGRTALQAAAGAGHGEVLKQLLQAKANVNAGAGAVYGRTALQAAVEGGHRNTMKILLSSGSDINAAPAKEEGKTVLQAALEKGDRRVMELILASDSFDVEAVLYSALERGQGDVVKELLESKDVDWNRKTGMYKETPLHTAVRHEHVKVFKLLLDIHQVDPNLTDAEGRSPLLTAVVLGHEQAVELLVKNKNVNVNLASSKRSTPILIAASTGHVQIVSLLLERLDVDVNLVSFDGSTPLHMAAKNGHHRVIQRLLGREGLDVNATDIKGASPLHLASLRGLENVVVRLLSLGRVDVNHRDGTGATPLRLAASAGAVAVVQRLLTRSEIQLNLADNEGLSPLHVAAQAGPDVESQARHHAVFEQLLAKGASINQRNKHKSTALHMAASAGYVAIVAMLLNAKDIEVDPPDDLEWTPLTYAAHGGHHEVVEQLLAKGVNMNHRNLEQVTPLMAAAYQGHELVVEILLAAQEINVSSPDSLGRTPLHLAALGGHHLVVERLLTKAVDVNHRDLKQATPLLLAAFSGYDLVVEKLLTAPKIDVNLPDDSGATPLTHGARLGHHLVVKRLLAQESVDVDSRFLAREGVDVDSHFLAGSTPLLIAAGEGYDVVVKQLLEKGADVNHQNLYGRTALLLAAMYGRDAAVGALLTMKKVKVNLMDINGATPLLVAAQNGHEAVLKSLLARGGVNVNCADGDRITPLITAARLGREGVVKQLLAHKDIDVNLLDAYGNTVLTHASSGAIRMLLEQARATQSVPKPTQG